jgi:hypothetical protein
VDPAATVRGLLVRGMLVGLGAGVLMFAFAVVFGEPQIDRAIAFEEAQNGAGAAGAPLVSRPMQASLGLLTGLVVYGVALGGIFALAFAAAHGRVGTGAPRVTAAVLAVAGFAVVVLVPFLKYPSNPPAVGADETIGERTRLFFLMLAVSLFAALAALRLGRDLVRRLGAWNGVIAAVGAYLVLIAVAQLAMPSIEEAPEGFSSAVIWHFRIATLGVHAVLWTTLGLGFGAAAQRLLAPARPREKASALA